MNTASKAVIKIVSRCLPCDTASKESLWKDVGKATNSRQWQAIHASISRWPLSQHADSNWPCLSFGYDRVDAVAGPSMSRSNYVSQQPATHPSSIE